MKIQKIFKTLLITAPLIFMALNPLSAAAATTNVTGGTNGPLCNSGGYFLPASVTITSGGTITFSVPSNDPYAGGIQINGFPQGSFVVPRGGSVTTNALTANVSYQGTWPGEPACVKGSGTVTVQAPVDPAPTPTPTPTPTPAAPTTTTPPTSTSTKSATSNAASSASPTAPATVVTTEIIVEGKQITSSQDLVIQQSQSLVLSGTTVPNGHITLTIHSTPKTVAVLADASGKWTYTFTGLQPGNHTIEATVKDPTTNQTSASAKLLSFTIKASSVAKATTSASTPAKKKSMILPVAIGILILLVLAASMWLVMVKKRRKTGAQQVVQSVVPSIESQPTSPQAVILSENVTVPPTSNTNNQTQTQETPQNESHENQ